MEVTRAAPGPEGRLTLLLVGTLGPPALWAARLGASYLLVPYACWHGWSAALHGVTLLTLAGCLAAGWIAWRSWRGAGGEAGGGGAADAGGPAVRARFMALLGVLMSAFFALVIVAEGTANVMIDPCISWGRPADWTR
jgi:hypothetical protein